MSRIFGLLVLGVALVSGRVATASVQFDIGSNGPSGNHWTFGTGWGTGSGQLDAVFGIDAGLPATSFTLNTGGSRTFNFGSITLNELTIDSNETDNLGVTGYLYFDSPPVGSVANPGTAVAVTGSVSDSGTDLTISFNPVTVNFGTNGQFRVELSDVVFKQCDTECVTATVKLLCEPTTNVPEPTTFAIWSLLGGLGLVFAWRKKRLAS